LESITKDAKEVTKSTKFNPGLDFVLFVSFVLNS